jgi:hypothetical protein
MNDKSKSAGKEEIFNVFRHDGDRNLSAENYSITKVSETREKHGPLTKNQWIDQSASLTGQNIEPHALTLSDANADAPAVNDDPSASTATQTENADSQTTIRLDTFRIGMEERLAAMQVAQQKAKDQLSDLEDQSQGTDKLPKS